MTTNICAIDGCDQPRHRTATKTYSYCTEHMREMWKRRSGPAALLADPKTTPVRVVYPYTGGQGDEIRIYEARLVETQPMPDTERELRQFLVQCEEDGYLIVQPEVGP